MLESVTENINRLSSLNFNALFLLGLILFVGTIGGGLLKKLRTPQVVGYIVAGIVLGKTGFNIIDTNMINTLAPFNYFALGLIGFMIGGELKKDVLRRYGKQFAIILLSEGLFAFLAVFIFVGVIGSLVFGNGLYYWALGLLLGAIASATAPAATTDVLWEYKTRGPLTSIVLGIVALDDGLALVLFALASSIAPAILGVHSSSWSTIIRPVYEIGVAILLGITFGFVLIKILRKYADREKILVYSISTILFVLGLSLIIDVDMLLAAMTLGVVLVNWEARLSKEVFTMVSAFATPFYILFFVMVGAKFELKSVTLSVIVIALAYLLGRTFGKMFGANFGSRISGAPKTVQKYLPYCLFSQAGVAIGLSIVAYNMFPGSIGNSIIIVITFTTFIVQLLGPPSVKYAVAKAGEIGLNVTQNDVLRRTNISEVMDKEPPLIYASMHLGEILDIFSNSHYHNYPVVDKDKKVVGVISTESIRQSLPNIEAGNLICAYDIMEPVTKMKIDPDFSLSEADELFDKYNLDYLPVADRHSRIVGFLEKRMINKFVSSKLIEAEQKITSLG